MDNLHLAWGDQQQFCWIGETGCIVESHLSGQQDIKIYQLRLHLKSNLNFSQLIVDYRDYMLGILIPLLSYSFLKNNSFYFYLKGRLYWKKRRERKRRFSTCWFTPQMSPIARVELVQSQELGASFSSPMWVQGPKVLNHPPLLSRTTSREQNENLSSWNINQYPYEMASPTLQISSLCQNAHFVIVLCF